MTLRFYPSIDPDRLVEAIRQWAGTPAALGRVVAAAGPAPTVMWGRIWALPVDGLDGLARSLASSLPQPPGDRSPSGFRGHLTLARGRRPGDLGHLAAPAVTAAWEVTRIEAVRSRLGGGPARHDVLGRWGLPPLP